MFSKNKTLVTENWLVIMSEVEDNWKYDSESRDLYQDRPMQGTIWGGSSVRQTRAKTFFSIVLERKRING